MLTIKEQQLLQYLVKVHYLPELENKAEESKVMKEEYEKILNIVNKDIHEYQSQMN